jgi:hypothetical protein
VLGASSLPHDRRSSVGEIPAGPQEAMLTSWAAEFPGLIRSVASAERAVWRSSRKPVRALAAGPFTDQQRPKRGHDQWLWGPPWSWPPPVPWP